MNIRKYLLLGSTTILIVPLLNVPNAMAKIDLLGVVESVVSAPGKVLNTITSDLKNHNYNSDNFYFSAHSGVVSFLSRDIAVGGSSEIGYGFTFGANFNAEIHMDTGYSAGGIIGYHFNDFIDIEIEGAYSHATYSDIDWGFSASITGTGDPYNVTVGNNATVDGEKKMWGFLISPILHPIKNEKFDLFMGAGLGFKRIRDDIVSIDGNETLSVDEKDYHIAGKLQAGLSYRITDSLAIKPRYSIEWMNNDWGPIEDDRWHEFNISITSEF